MSSLVVVSTKLALSVPFATSTNAVAWRACTRELAFTLVS